MPENSETSRPQVQLLSINPAHYARQITLVEIERFKAIKPEELKSIKWTGQEKEKHAPNIVASTRWFNQINFWVQKEILMCEDLLLRVEVLSHFIYIAEQLVGLNNLYSAMAVMSALQTECIYRLKITWFHLPPAAKQVYKRLESFFSQKDNCYRLREYTRNLPLPSIPYLGMYLSDLTYTNIAHPKEAGGRPSAVLLKKIDTIIQPILYFQQSVFPFTKNETIYNYLMSQRYLDSLQRFVEDDNYKLSLKLEPKMSSQTSNESSNTLRNDDFKKTSLVKPSTNHFSRNNSFFSDANVHCTNRQNVPLSDEDCPKSFNHNKLKDYEKLNGNTNSVTCANMKPLYNANSVLDESIEKIDYIDSKLTDDVVKPCPSPTYLKKTFPDSDHDQTPTSPDFKPPTSAITYQIPLKSPDVSDLAQEPIVLCQNCKCQMNATATNRVGERTTSNSLTDTQDFSFDTTTDNDRSRRPSEDILNNHNRSMLRADDFVENLNRGILLTCIHAHLMTENRFPTESFNIQILHEGWVKRKTLPYKHHASTCTDTNPSSNQIIPNQSASPTCATAHVRSPKDPDVNPSRQKSGIISELSHSKETDEYSSLAANGQSKLSNSASASSSGRRMTLSSFFSSRLFPAVQRNRSSLAEDKNPSIASPFKIQDKLDSDESDESLDDLNESFRNFSASHDLSYSGKKTRRKSSFLKHLRRTIHSNSLSGQSPSMATEQLSGSHQWKSAWALLVVMTPGKSNPTTTFGPKTERKKHQRTISNVSNWTEPSLNEDNFYDPDNGPSNSQSISSNNFPSLFDAQASLVYLVFFPKAKSKVLDLHKCYLQCLSRSLSHPIAKVHHAVHKNGNLDTSSFVISSRLKADQQTPNIVRIRPLLRNPLNYNQNGSHQDSQQPRLWSTSLLNPFSASDSPLGVISDSACRSPVKQIKNFANSLNCTAKQNYPNNSPHSNATAQNTMTTNSHQNSAFANQAVDEQALLVNDWLLAIRKALLM